MFQGPVPVAMIDRRGKHMNGKLLFYPLVQAFKLFQEFPAGHIGHVDIQKKQRRACRAWLGILFTDGIHRDLGPTKYLDRRIPIYPTDDKFAHHIVHWVIVNDHDPVRSLHFFVFVVFIPLTILRKAEKVTCTFWADMYVKQEKNGVHTTEYRQIPKRKNVRARRPQCKIPKQILHDFPYSFRSHPKILFSFISHVLCPLCNKTVSRELEKGPGFCWIISTQSTPT